ncbi:MAG: hypothetical protein PW735_07475 [Acidobacteriaceae bacterium]|nr:hypothetical protein [Acidobacteriaceae bacterium]
MSLVHPVSQAAQFSELRSRHVSRLLDASSDGPKEPSHYGKAALLVSIAQLIVAVIALRRK